MSIQNINVQLRGQLNFNQWTNTTDVINWFSDLPNKERCNFIKFDIVDFYPSISEELLSKALDWADTFADISEDDRKIIITAKNSLLYSEKQPWKKKEVDNFFDVTMGSFDGAETCELVGLYLLSQLADLNLKTGLYRDDGLSVSTLTKRQNDGIKKKICEIFRKNNLKITIEANLKVTDFLDVTLELDTGIYRPFIKQNNTLLYVNINSNHPPNIQKNIPENINKRLNSLSINENVFKEAIPPYQKALKDAGYNYQLKYQPPTPATVIPRRPNRPRNITWYNPPFCRSLKTNLGKEFFRILDSCFPKENSLSKIFNHNTVKLSFSCMLYVGKFISSHNKRLIQPTPEVPACKCRDAECPVDGDCEKQNIIYQCKVTETMSGTSDSYIGLSGKTFKDRVTKHNKSFRDRTYHKNSLSSHIWRLKDQNKQFKIAWRIVDQTNPYTPA